MRISTKGSYALEAMLAIALFPIERAVSIREISERTGISDKYLEQIFLLLKESGLLIGTRGVGGGYVTAKPTDQITVGEILRAAETSFSPVPCLTETGVCDKTDSCISRHVWVGLDQTIAKRTETTTLQDLALRFQSDRAASSDNYSI